MPVIREDDFIDSISAALQYISYYHPQDFIRAMAAAFDREAAPAARDAIAQILTNSRLCAEGHRPICQDTGIVTVFLEVGMEIRWQGGRCVEDMVNEAVRRAYTDPGNPLRASIVSDPAGARANTRDNTPAVVHTEIVPGDRLGVTVAAKGAGSENKSKFAVLNPGDDLVQWVLDQVPVMGAGWCPPGMLGLGIGGTAEKAMLLAKMALMEPIDIHELKARGPANRAEALRLELFDKVNALGIGAQGLGGLTTVLDVKVKDYPTHAASLPVALIPNCAATRHAHFVLDGSGPSFLAPPPRDAWPDIDWQPAPESRRIDLERIGREDLVHWKPGEILLLSGRILTARDAAHQRICNALEQGRPLPDGLDLDNRFIYYVGPVDAVGDEAVGPAGPTTATRMDKFTSTLLDNTGLLGMIGKAERGPDTIRELRRHRAVYLIATGGAAYLIARAIRQARVIAYPELGMEAVYEFEVVDMPVTVAVDVNGASVHQTGPEEWRNRIAGIPIEPA